MPILERNMIDTLKALAINGSPRLLGRCTWDISKAASFPGYDSQLTVKGGRAVAVFFFNKSQPTFPTQVNHFLIYV